MDLGRSTHYFKGAREHIPTGGLIMWHFCSGNRIHRHFVAFLFWLSYSSALCDISAGSALLANINTIFRDM